MRLFLTDYHLEACRLCMAQNNPDTARNNLNKAQKLIKQTGCLRRQPEAEELENEIRKVLGGLNR